MDCVHLIAGVQLHIGWLQRKCAEVLATSSGGPAGSEGQPRQTHGLWKCAECSSTAENWMCLHCGTVLCGRYIKQHALQHSLAAANREHCICLHTLNRTVYCYACDDFVINDTPTGDLAAFRAAFPSDHGDCDRDDDDDVMIVAEASANGSAAETAAKQSNRAKLTANTSSELKTETGSEEVAPSNISASSTKRYSQPAASPAQLPSKKGRRSASDTTASASASSTAAATAAPLSEAAGQQTRDSTAAGGLLSAAPLFIMSPVETNGGRNLRPRKRTASAEHQLSLAAGQSAMGGGGDPVAAGTTAKSGRSAQSSAAKRKALRKVVGLRNLGNTCFMNSVLQSLSNIREFTCYFNALPSLDAGQNGGGSAEKGGGSEKAKAKRVYHPRSLKENHGASAAAASATAGGGGGGDSDANVVEELRKILQNLSDGGDGSKAISPECLFLVIWKVVPQFRGHRQHDAHEFLRYMLDRLHTELQNVPVPAHDTATSSSATASASTETGTTTTTSATDSASAAADCSPSSCGNLQVGPATTGLDVDASNNSIMFKGRTSIVTSVFGGTLQSEVRCLICGTESKKHDPFLDLSLDIPEKFYKCRPAEDGQPGGKPPNSCHIADCLSSFTEIEELAETELYYCSACKCKQKSTKRFWIRRLPNVLCLHIKRFRWNNFFRTKIDLRITFPITSMDMSQFVLNSGPETRRSTASTNVYDLAAVIVHHGNGSSCGHYTSYAINNGTWLHFNDHTVKEVQPSAVEECKPYILFYIRRDANASKS